MNRLPRFLAILTISTSALANAEEHVYSPWILPIAIESKATQRTADTAAVLARGLGLTIPPIKADASPGCVLWIRVNSELLPPNSPGYLVVLARDGAVVMASDDDQLEKATQSILAAIRKDRTGKISLPSGLITSFPMATERGDSPVPPKADGE